MRQFSLISFCLLITTACSPSATNETTSTDPALSAFRQCAVCHSVADPETPAGKIRLAGPNLHGVYGAPAARRDYAYSNAMRKSAVIWDEASLDAYIEKPSAFIRGNRMAFSGEKDAEKRALIIEYLKQQQ